MANNFNRPRGRPPRPVIERFMEKVLIHEGTHYWEWTACKDGRGIYGLFQLDGRAVNAHRVSYILFVGDPGDNDVHHKCEVELCVNPDCLELKEPSVHVSEHRRAISVCRNNHPLSGDNLVVQKSTGKRSCRICRNQSMRAKRARDRERA